VTSRFRVIVTGLIDEQPLLGGMIDSRVKKGRQESLGCSLWKRDRDCFDRSVTPIPPNEAISAIRPRV
jgi:hypothetical protein